jgi:hypothetical protein|tara:strand:- start:6281 stop:6799 length:519 start_codon:yes stop_codon:yes gene_type:complete
VENKLSLEEIRKQIEGLDSNQVILIIGIALIMLYLVLTKTQRGRQVRRKFRILPKLIPLEEEYETYIEEPDNLDGSNRQLKGEIIENEHDILNKLLGNEGAEELEGFSEEDALIFKDQEETIPLPNQNFGDMKEHINSATESQEYCASCNKPVKPEWKACPFCGEFLEIYED